MVARYRSDAAGDRRADHDQPQRESNDKKRWGNGDVEITGVELFTGDISSRLLPSGSSCRLCIDYAVNTPVEDFVFGVAWHRSDGTQVSGHNTDLAGFVPARLQADGSVCCRYDALELAPGEYVIDVAVHARDGLAYDYWCDALTVRVTSDTDWPGIWSPAVRWQTNGPEWQKTAVHQGRKRSDRDE